MGTTKGPIPIILCVDVEPSVRRLDPSDPDPWAGYAFMHRYLGEMRARFETATGRPCRFSWFVRCDPQIQEVYGRAEWGVERYPEFVASNLEQGDAYGVHTHAYRWLATERDWVIDYAQDWVEHCVRESLAAFERAFGTRCELFRFGDHWLNTETVNLLESLSVRYDLTVEPGLTGAAWIPPDMRTLGEHPDYRRVPRTPYTPRQDDFLRPERRSARSIRLIPLTSAYERSRRPLRDYLGRIRDSGFAHRNQVAPLSMWRDWTEPNAFEQMLDRALAAQSRPYLAMAVRTEPPSRRNICAAVDRCFRTLLRYVERGSFELMTVQDAMRETTPLSLKRPERA